MCWELTELLLIGFFDRINLDPKIQIKYVDTKNKLADILIKGNFSRNERNHFLYLFNIMCFRHVLVAIWKVFSLKSESALWLVPCRNEDKTQPRVMGLQRQKPELPVWCCKVSAKRVLRHTDRDLQSSGECSATGKELASPRETG